MKFKDKQKLLNGSLITGLSEVERTLKLHGQAHMAQDLLPQFILLVKKVEKLEGQLNFKLNDGPIMNHSKRIADLEKQAAYGYKRGTDHCVDIIELKKRWLEMDEGIKSMLAALPEIEILKTQVKGLEKWKGQLAQRLNLGACAIDRIDAIEAKMKEQRADYHAHIRQLVEENAAAHIQQSDTIMHMQEQIKGLENRLSRCQDMVAECHPDGYVGMPINGEKKKTCTNCIYGDGAYCNHETPSRCTEYDLWVSRSPIPLKGKPKPRKAGKKTRNSP